MSALYTEQYIGCKPLHVALYPRGVVEIWVKLYSENTFRSWGVFTTQTLWLCQYIDIKLGNYWFCMSDTRRTQEMIGAVFTYWFFREVQNQSQSACQYWFVTRNSQHHRLWRFQWHSEHHHSGEIESRSHAFTRSKQIDCWYHLAGRIMTPLPRH